MNVKLFTARAFSPRIILNLPVCFQDAESDGAKIFKEVAAGIDELPFGITSNADLFTEHNMDADGVMLFKKVIVFKLIAGFTL